MNADFTRVTSEQTTANRAARKTAGRNAFILKEQPSCQPNCLPENLLSKPGSVLHAQLERMRRCSTNSDLFYSYHPRGRRADRDGDCEHDRTFPRDRAPDSFLRITSGPSAYFLTYVVFARVYATGIERRINRLLQDDVMIAHRLEASYLFPLSGQQFAGVPVRADQTFIGFITLHFWLLGAASIFLAAYRAWQLLPLLVREFPILDYYFPLLIAWSLLHLVYLVWYFGTRYHERRIMQIVAGA